MYGDQRGQHIDPATRPELLARIFAGDGENRRSITSYPMTSGFGPRNLDIPGASKFHKGQDYAIPAGVPLYIQGATDYFSQNGVGVAKLNDAQGRPYEIELFHTDPGKFMQATAPVPAASAPVAAIAARGPNSGPVGSMGAFDDYRSPEEKEVDRFLKPQFSQEPPSLEDVKKAILLTEYQQGGQSQKGASSKAVQDMQRSLSQMISALRSGQTEEQRTRLALDKAVDRAAAAFQGGKSVI